ncbi:MAG: transposase, partial [Patescibacteria group bacterium]
IVFNNSEDYTRMIEILNLYRYANFTHKYSKYIQLDLQTQTNILQNLRNENNLLVEIMAYCVMPTHFHLILKQVEDGGISHYMGKVLNCYSRYFNIKHRRSGPLWSGRFKSVLVSNDEQLLHLSRYIHLNPTSINLVRKPKDWLYSSYAEYISPESINDPLCTFKNIIDMPPNEYKKFVLDRKNYQKQISLIKNILIDDYTG